jgi:hypothetical protein
MTTVEREGKDLDLTKGICLMCVHYLVPWHYCKKEHAMMTRRGFATDCTAFEAAEPAKQEGQA